MGDLADLLAAGGLFAGLDPDDRAAVAGLARRRNHAAGAVLFRSAVRLSRHGLLTRRQTLRLVRWSTHLHRVAIRLLRQGRW